MPLLNDVNPVDAAWGKERPLPPSDGIRVHPMEWAGETVGDKVARMMKQVGATHVVLLGILDPLLH